MPIKWGVTFTISVWDNHHRKMCWLQVCCLSNTKVVCRVHRNEYCTTNKLEELFYKMSNCTQIEGLDYIKLMGHMVHQCIYHVVNIYDLGIVWHQSSSPLSNAWLQNNHPLLVWREDPTSAEGRKATANGPGSERVHEGMIWRHLKGKEARSLRIGCVLRGHRLYKRIQPGRWRDPLIERQINVSYCFTSNWGIDEDFGLVVPVFEWNPGSTPLHQPFSCW